MSSPYFTIVVVVLTQNQWHQTPMTRTCLYNIIKRRFIFKKVHYNTLKIQMKLQLLYKWLETVTILLVFHYTFVRDLYNILIACVWHAIKIKVCLKTYIVCQDSMLQMSINIGINWMELFNLLCVKEVGINMFWFF